nr:SusC/RagA family TonB-linked outer membrane protein [uncultured Allomuricauda sp.]
MYKYFSKKFPKGTIYTVLMLFIYLLPTSNIRGNMLPQQETLSIDQRISIKELFTFISNKTTYDFFFNSGLEDLDTEIDLTIENATVREVLNKALNGLPLEYSITGNDILIRKKTVKTNASGQKNVSGIIKDEYGNPLTYVSVIIKGSNTGTVSDFDGKFNIDATSSDILEFTYMGYESKTIRVGNNTYFDVELVPQFNVLDEVIVSGVATDTERKKLSVSVAKLNTDDISKVPQASISSSLQAKIAGVSVTSFSGSPGSSPNIVLRGSTNLTGNNSPMILVDGVILQGSLADINVDDIESMEVVKGAAASSLYGSRAANGVIVITSKRGKKIADGKTSITVRSETGFQQVANYLDLSNSHHYMLAPDWLSTDTFTKYYFVDYPGDYTTGWDPRIQGNRVEKEDHYQDMPYRVNNDLQKQMFNNGRYSTNYIGVGHRVNNTNLYLSFENNQNEGTVRETGGYKRNSVRANIDHAISDNIKLSASNNFIRTSNDLVYGGSSAFSSFFEVLMSDPDIDLLKNNVDGQQYNVYPNHWNTQFANPLYDLWKKERKSRKTRFLGSYEIDWKFTDWLSFKGAYAIESQDYRRTNYVPKGSIVDLLPNLIDPNDPASIDNENPIAPQYSDGGLEKYTSNIFNQTVRATINFKKTWGELDFNGKLSYLYENNHFEHVQTEGSEFTLPDLPSLNYFTRDNIYASDSNTDIKAQNYFAIASFVYKDRYIVDGLYRRDGSSLFGSNERWQNYYRISGAYRLSKDIRIPGIQEFKLRAAYGTSGLRPAFAAQYETFNANDGTFSKSTLGNANLKPSRSNELEVGIETSFLKRFRFEATYSNTQVTDQYLKSPLPSHAGGFPYQWVNAGELETNTFEASLNSTIFSNEDFSWDINLVFDRTRQKITKLNIPEYRTGPRSAFKIKENETYGSMYGVDFVRSLEQMQAQLPDGDDIGDYTINRDGLVVKTADIGTAEEKPFVMLDETGAEKNMKIGDINPDFRLGLNTNLRYKGWSLYMLWQWKQGGDLYNGTAQYLVRDNRHAMIDQIHTRPENKKTVDYYQALYDAQALNGFWVEDASFVKLKEAAIYFQINSENLGKAGNIFDHIRIGALGRNLLTFTKYSGYDPEAGDDGFLFDNFGYPNFRNYTLSVEFKL